MAIRKVYQSTRFTQDDYYINVNGTRTLVKFVGGSLQPRINGKFSTSDPVLIKAIESSNGYGVDFKCIQSQDLPDPVVKSKAPAFKAPSVVETGNTGSDEGNAPQDAEQVAGVSNVQAAREYMLERFKDELTASALPNGNAIKKAAAERNIVFTDLK